MVSLISIVNYTLEALPDIGNAPITLQRIFGIIMYPFAWLLGIPEADIFKVSEIIGTKFVLNETIAYFDIVQAGISKESVLTTIYAITNFGNFACIGMTVGGLMAMCPTQKDIPSLGFRSFIAGTLATGLTATLMSVLCSVWL
jgi:CNT family concentrative nucleoside transporter